MNQITTENFGCFRAGQAARLAPLTLLVGENSTGKTSFLALIRALWDAVFRYVIPDFKETPYDLGSFDEIAHFRGRGAGRPQEFTGGFSIVPNLLDRRKRVFRAGSRPCRFEFTSGRRGTALAPTTALLACDDLAITDRITDGAPQEVYLRTGRGEWPWRVPVAFSKRLTRDGRLPQLFTHPGAAEARHLTPVGGSPKITDDDRARLEELFSLFDDLPVGPRPFASAPVGSRPLRTYDPSRPSRDPEGETGPMYLSTAYFEDEESWKALKGALKAVECEAGLFDGITVSPLGQRSSEPFQMQSASSDAAPKARPATSSTSATASVKCCRSSPSCSATATRPCSCCGSRRCTSNRAPRRRWAVCPPNRRPAPAARGRDAQRPLARPSADDGCLRGPRVALRGGGLSAPACEKIPSGGRGR